MVASSGYDHYRMKTNKFTHRLQLTRILNGSTDPTDSGVVMHTIINGGGSGSVVTCDNGEGASTVLSGFVITGGDASQGGG